VTHPISEHKRDGYNSMNKCHVSFHAAIEEPTFLSSKKRKKKKQPFFMTTSVHH
jgi:hypothetical protein